MKQQEYALYQENFEIYQFKFKTYGAGKWADTYDEAHELAKEAVLKKCMEENPHLAFQSKFDKECNAPPQKAKINGVEFPSDAKFNSRNDGLNLPTTIPEKINKGTIEEQIQAFEGTPEELKAEWFYVASTNKRLKIVYDEKEKQLQLKHQPATH